jgi:hypothetical protein
LLAIVTRCARSAIGRKPPTLSYRMCLVMPQTSDRTS